MIRIGTRGSDLALWQARHVAELLEQKHGVTTDLVIVKTRGDTIQDVPLTPELGKSFFTKEIEDGLLAGDFDVAVHSLKDLAVDMPEGLCLGAVTERASPGETLLIRPDSFDLGEDPPLRYGARVGTGSPRRRKYLLELRDDLVIEPLRGNVPTRIDKLRRGEHDAIVVATAALARLEPDLAGLQKIPALPTIFPGAPGQGALGLQVRESDAATRELVRAIEHGPSARATAIERRLLAALGGGCSLPLGAYCEIEEGGQYRLHAFLFDPDGDESSLEVDLLDADADRVVEHARRALAPALEQPLDGVTLAVVGSALSSRITLQLLAAGALAVPVIAYEQRATALAADDLSWIAQADHIGLASATAVFELDDALAEAELELAADATLVCPGRATAREAHDYFPGYEVVLADPPRGEGIGRVATERGAKRLAIVGAQGGNTDAVTTASSAGIEARHFAIYENASVEPDLGDVSDAAVPIYLSTAAVRSCDPEHFDAEAVVAIGPSTAKALAARTQRPVLIADTPDLAGIITLIQETEKL